MQKIIGGFINLNESFGKTFGKDSSMKNLFESVKDEDEISLEADVKTYFETYFDGKNPRKFSFDAVKFLKRFPLNVEEALTFLINMENEKVMKEIYQGKYDNFDIEDSTLFNDDYQDIYDEYQGTHDHMMDYQTLIEEIIDELKTDKSIYGYEELKLSKAEQKITLWNKTFAIRVVVKQKGDGDFIAKVYDENTKKYLKSFEFDPEDFNIEDGQSFIDNIWDTVEYDEKYDDEDYLEKQDLNESFEQVFGSKMKNLNESTSSGLTKEVVRILNDEFDIPDTEPTVRRIGQMLCGQNWKLAEKPFSREFLENVQHNGPSSFKLVIWLQLNAL